MGKFIRGPLALEHSRGPLAPKPRRGQLTLETLLLGAITLSLILISAQALSKMRQSEQTLLERKIILDEVQGLAAYSDEICILGAGNSRTMELAPGVRLNLSAGGKELVAQAKDWNASAKTMCPEKVENAEFGQTAYLWYEDSGGSAAVHISPSPKP